ECQVVGEALPHRHLLRDERAGRGRHAGTPCGSSCDTCATTAERPARNVVAQHVARSAAPITRCVVVGTTERCVQMIEAPSEICTTSRATAKTASRRSG